MKTEVGINQIRDRLLQLNCWYVGEIKEKWDKSLRSTYWEIADRKEPFYPNPPSDQIGDWQFIKSEISGWVDIRCNKDLYCYWVEEDDNCPINTDGRSEEVCDRVIEYLKSEIEQVMK